MPDRIESENSCDASALGGITNSPPIAQEVGASSISENLIEHRFFWQSQLGKRLLISILLFSSFVALVVAALELHVDYRSEVGRIHKELEDIESGFSDPLGESLWIVDSKQINLLIDSIAKLPNIQYVEVQESRPNNISTTVAARGQALNPNWIKKTIPLTFTSGGGPRPIGFLIIEVSPDHFHRNLVYRAVGILISETSKIFLITAFTLVLINIQIVRRLLNFTRDIQATNPQLPPASQKMESTPDELDELANAFIQLRENIALHMRHQQITYNQLIKQEQDFHTLVDNLPLLIARYDKDCQLVYANPALEALLKKPLDALQGKKPSEVFSGIPLEDYQDRIIKTIENGAPDELDIVVEDNNAQERIYHIKIVGDPGESGLVQGALTIGTDMTDRKKMEDSIRVQETKLLFLAHHDALTGLPNRVLLADRLKSAIFQAERAKTLLAIAYLDLDSFKPINDTYGHEVGDQVLVELTHRMGQSLRNVDTIARIGGDEFVILMTGQHNTLDLDRGLKRLLESISAPMFIGGINHTVSASVGISMYPEDGDEPDMLLRNADQAMYIAKRSGRNQFVFFGQGLRETHRLRTTTTHDLRDAIDGGQITAYFQPIFDIATGQFNKAEALARWIHPKRGLISPAEFIALAEETGLISALEDKVFKLSLKTVKKWNQLCPQRSGAPPCQISVNRSPRHFFNEHSIDSWIELLRQMKIPGEMIAIEITEGLLLDDRPHVTYQLHQIQSAGISLSLDDFGTGYSALSYLNKFRFDILKIDRSFIQNSSLNAKDQTIVESIIAMANRLGIKTIAEGVETEAQRDMLTSAQCDMIQGYLYAKPLPSDEFIAFMNSQSGTPPTNTR